MVSVEVYLLYLLTFTYFLYVYSAKNSYISYLLEMDKFIKDNPDLPVFNVSYEDTKEVSIDSSSNDYDNNN